MSANECCRLCLNENLGECLDIFGSQGVSLDIGPIISTHFQFQVSTDRNTKLRQYMLITNRPSRCQYLWTLKFQPIKRHTVLLCTQINTNDTLSTLICSMCWFQIETFHAYYQTVQIAQSQIQTKLDAIKAECQSAEDMHLHDVKMEQSPSFDVLFSDALNSNVDEKPSYADCSFDGHTADATHFDDDDMQIEHIQRTVKRELKRTQKRKSSPKARRQPKSRKKRKSKEKPSADVHATRELSDELICRWCTMQCEFCHQIFDRFVNVKRHYRDEHREIGFVTCCKKKFFLRVRLMEHISKHMNPEAFRYLDGETCVRKRIS